MVTHGPIGTVQSGLWPSVRHTFPRAAVCLWEKAFESRGGAGWGGGRGIKWHMGREGGAVGTPSPAGTLPWCLFQKRVLFLTNDYFFTDISDTPFR